MIKYILQIKGTDPEWEQDWQDFSEHPTQDEAVLAMRVERQLDSKVKGGNYIYRVIGRRKEEKRVKGKHPKGKNQ